jgi:hypothetical protein
MKKREERIFISFWKKNRRRKETCSEGQEIESFRWPLTTAPE